MSCHVVSERWLENEPRPEWEPDPSHLSSLEHYFGQGGSTVAPGPVELDLSHLVAKLLVPEGPVKVFNGGGSEAVVEREAGVLNYD